MEVDLFVLYLLLIKIKHLLPKQIFILIALLKIILEEGLYSMLMQIKNRVF